MVEGSPEQEHELQPKGSKRRRKDDILARYPVTPNDSSTEDRETIERFKNGIAKELMKSKPRDSILLPLMKSTFNERRMYILGEPVSLANMLDLYPALKRPAIVSIYDMHVLIDIIIMK